jgi:hypothetical protein
VARRQRNLLKSLVGAAIVLANSASASKCLKANHRTMCPDCAHTTFRSARFHVAPSMPHSSLVSKLTINILASYLCYTMGANTQGQLGVDDPVLEQKCSPVLVDLLLNFKPLLVVCGSFHTIVKTKGGEAFSWGSNEWGQCGTKNGSQVHFAP